MNDLNVAAVNLQQVLLFGPPNDAIPNDVVDMRVRDLLCALDQHYVPNDLKPPGKVLLLLVMLAMRVAELERLLKEGSR